MSGLADSVIARMLKERDLLQALDEHCHSISAVVTSRDGSVSVEADGLGAMTGLRLRPTALKLGPKVLAKLIIDTAEAAARVCADRQNFLVAEFNRRMSALDEKPSTGGDGTTTTSR
ncbi:YbaB/EbfC family nucleoid-associated protein [Mycobacterium heidelbergense]|uniref:YbaB/EbfC family nucleoid-associated protein n=1 Tax=Mycobacterium heidelbergense TaxID=53376 RepID=UPI003CEBC24D